MPPVTTIDMPALCVRADLSPASFNADDRTIEAVFSTGAAVTRSDWWTGKSYIEKLAIDTKAIRLARLNSSAPVLNTHSGWSLEDQIGVVVPGSARVEGGKAIATLRFSARDSVKPIVQDIRDGIVRNVSVGYKTFKFEETTGKDGALPVRLATDWEPYEISMVPMPADVAAQTRSGRSSRVELYPCEIVRIENVTADADRVRSLQLARARA